MDERKEYSVVGAVTIGTDEYRDLLEDKFKAEHDKDYYMREGWKKDTEINNLKKQVESLSCELNKKHCQLNSEDSITLFCSNDVVF